jgi:hypothetical protein
VIPWHDKKSSFRQTELLEQVLYEDFGLIVLIWLACISDIASQAN